MIDAWKFYFTEKIKNSILLPLQKKTIQAFQLVRIQGYWKHSRPWNAPAPTFILQTFSLSSQPTTTLQHWNLHVYTPFANMLLAWNFSLALQSFQLFNALTLVLPSIMSANEWNDIKFIPNAFSMSSRTATHKRSKPQFHFAKLPPRRCAEEKLIWTRSQ